MKILIAEDHDHLRELMSDYLRANGYEVDTYANGQLANEGFLVNTYDLVLLDIMMPEMDGFTLCEKIREKENVPVLFLTAKVQEADQLHGYEVGCDDYIIKPFSLPVLLAKCKVLLERRNIHQEITIGILKVDEKNQKVYLKDQEIELKALDYKLLLYLVKNPDQTLTRESILLKVWGYDYEGYDRSVDTHIKNLRKALSPYKCITTVIKTGYRFETKGLKIC